MRTTGLRQAMAATVLALGLAAIAPTGAAAVGLGKKCGGVGGIPCDSGLWCDLKAGQCNVADAMGRCVKIPDECPKNIRWVCGCDKKDYTNNCVRLQAKIQKDHNGHCKK
jgi:hypothetical protein